MIGYFYLILLAIIVLFAVIFINKIINIKIKEQTISKDNILRDTKYNEEEIVKHLDYIINEALDQYILFNITPKDIYYINNAMEEKIINYLVEEIPKRMSKILFTQLSFIYSNEYVGEYIAYHIYIIVLSYVLEFNINNQDHKKNKK